MAQIWIKILLIALVLVALLFFVRREHGHKLQANKRIGFILFIGMNIYAIARPQDVTWVAQQLGVGRGADLILYLLVITFVFAVFNFYLKMREADRRVTELARAIAVRDAELVNRERGLLFEWSANNPEQARNAE